MTERPVCIVTGARGGIASGVARRLHRDDYALVLTSRSGGAESAEELGQVGFAGSVLEDAVHPEAIAGFGSRGGTEAAWRLGCRLVLGRVQGGTDAGTGEGRWEGAALHSCRSRVPRPGASVRS